MQKYKILALFGKSGSGKDTIQKWIVSNIPNTQGIISCTTRPKRDYEKNKIDYFFLSKEKFAEKIFDSSMLEATSFRGWFYGTPLDSLSLDKINVGVFNPAGIECLLADSRLEILPVYVAADDKIRLMRNLQREENPDCAEICRQFFTDEKDFESFNIEKYQLLTNNSNDISNIGDAIKKIINNFDQK